MEKKVDKRMVYDLRLSNGDIGLRVDGNKIYTYPYRLGVGGFVMEDTLLAEALAALIQISIKEAKNG